MYQLVIRLIKNLPVSLACVTCFAFPVHADTQTALIVTLPDMEVNLTYSQPARLEQVLTDTQNLKLQHPKTMPFWLAAQWIEPAKNEIINEQKYKLIGQLQKFAEMDEESRHKARILINTIKREVFSYRHFISLDNDWVRLKDKANPLLSGHYKLITTSRTDKIRVIGVQSTLHLMDFIEHGSIDQYLEQMNLPENSETHQVYIIQPDGTLILVDNAYWNAKPVFLVPGATIFIGFNSLPDEFEHLNQNIAQLLRHQAPLTDKDAE